MAHRQVINVQIWIESSVEDRASVRGYVISALKNACRHVRDATVLMTITDVNNKIIGVDMTGSPSEDLQSSFDDLLDKLEDNVQHDIRVVPGPPPGRGPH